MGGRAMPWDRLAIGTVPVLSLILQLSRTDRAWQRLLAVARSEPDRIEANLRAVRRGGRSRECGHLEQQFGIRSSMHVGGYELERCVGAGRTAEVWKVRALGSHPPRHLAMKLWKSAAESPEKACNLVPILLRRNPRHLQVCKERGHYITEGGNLPGVRVAYSLADFVEEVPLYHFRNASDDQLPRLLWRLRGVFDACIQLVDLMEEGMGPFSYGGCQLRYIVGDPHPWNFIVDSLGKVRLLDFDDTRCCASCPDGDSLGELPAECRESCHPLWVRHYRHEAGRVLLQSLLLLLTRWRGDVLLHETHCIFSEACWGLVGGWEMSLPEALPSAQNFTDERVGRVVRHLLSHLRGAYFQDWSSLRNATGALIDAFLAVRDGDDAWPPRIIDFLRNSHAALS